MAMSNSKSKTMSRRRKLLLSLFAAAGVSLTLAGDAWAIIGRPATPASVAGVARRSVRRAPVVR